MKNIKGKLKTILLKPQSIASGTISLMVFTILSKLLGFVREMILAANFGTSWRLDALVVAMDPAINLGSMVASAIASMTIPIYISEKAKDEEARKRYVTQILFISSLLLVVFGIILCLFPETLIKIFAPHFGQRELEYAVRKMRILGLLPLIQGFNALVSAFFRAEKRYLLISVTQLFFNFTAIPVILIFSPILSESSYLLCFIAGTLVMNIINFIIIKPSIKLKYLRGSFRNPKIKETLKLAFPLIFSGSLSLIYNIIDKAFASSLQEGSIISLRFAQTINSMITSVLIGSFLTTLFTEFSEIHERKDMSALEIRLKKSCRDILNFTIPFTAWLIIMAHPLITLLLERGNFTSESTTLVSGAFIGYTISFTIGPVNLLISRLFEATKKTRVLLFISIINVLLNVLFNSLLIGPLGITGLALSSSLIVFIQFFMTLILEKKYFNLKFFDKGVLLKNLSITTLLFFLSFYLQGKMNATLWLILTNIVFLSLFVFLNRQILKSLKKRLFSRVGK